MLPVSSAVSWKSRLEEVPTDEARLFPSVISEMKLVPMPRIKISTASPETKFTATPGRRMRSSPGLAAGLPKVSVAATVLAWSAWLCN